MRFWFFSHFSGQKLARNTLPKTNMVFLQKALGISEKNPSTNPPMFEFQPFVFSVGFSGDSVTRVSGWVRDRN